MARTKPGEIRNALPAAPPVEPEYFGAMIADLDRLIVPGPVALAAPALLRLFPGQRELVVRPRRPRQHRPRRARAVLAGEPRPDGARGSRHRLDAPDARPPRRLQRRHPGHRLDQHAGGADLRARAGDRFALARGGLQASDAPLTVYASAHAHSSVDKAALLAGFGRDNLRLSLSTPPTRCAPTRWRTRSRQISRGATALRRRRHRRHDGDHRARPVAADRGRRAAAWPLAACRRRDGRQRDDPAGMPLDVARRRGRRFAGVQPAQMARRRPSTARSTTSAIPHHLVRVMCTNPSYLRSTVDGQVKNFRDWGIPLGRRFRALKLWFLSASRASPGCRRGCGATSTTPAGSRHSRRDARLAGPRAGPSANRLRPPRAGRARRRGARPAHPSPGSRPSTVPAPPI